MSESGIGSRMAIGTAKLWNQPIDQDRDEHQHDREGDAEVAEHLVGDLPLAVPLERRPVARERRRDRVALHPRVRRSSEARRSWG